MKNVKKLFYGLTIFTVLVLSVKYYGVNFVENSGKNINQQRNTRDIADKTIKQKDRPDLAVLQNNEMTLDPALGYPPVERSVKAFEKMKSMFKTARTVDQAKWVERGPLRVGGRTRTLMFDPNDPTQKKVFAGAIGGGIWYTEDITNPNVRWNSVNDFMANLAVSSIVHDPSNTQVFYASTGLGFTGDIRGVGIFKSDDAGSTWSHLNSTDNEDFHFVQKLAVLRDGSILAGTRLGLYISQDAGESWTMIWGEDVADIEVDSQDNIYASVNFRGGTGMIYKSTDIGANWTEITPAMGGRRIEMAIAPSDEKVIYAIASDGGDIAWFYKSIDEGVNWEILTIPSYLSQTGCAPSGHFTRGQSWFDLILSVHPLYKDVVLVGGIDLHRSLDGGQNWESMSYWTGACDDYVHADQHAIAFRPNHANEAIFGNDGGVFYSENVVAQNPEFIQRNLNYNVTTFYSLAYANEINSHYFLAGAQDNGTQQFFFPGINETEEPTGGDGAYCFIDKDDPQIQITSFVFDAYYISTDGGENFTPTEMAGSSNSGRFINPTEYDSKHNNMYAAGNPNNLIRLLDVPNETALEAVEIEIDGHQITHLKISPHTDHRLFIGVRVNGSEAQLFRLDNVNTNSPLVTEITGNYEGSHGGWVSSIDIGENDDHLVATFSNYGISSVYETKDGGNSWQDKEGNLPDMPVRWGTFNPQDRNEYIIATELGVWATLDIGATSPDWKPINTNQANVRTDMVKVREADNLLIAATHGRGLFTSDVLIDMPQAIFEVQQVGYEGTSINFTDQSHGGVTNWNWDFGDGNSSSEEHPTHMYSIAANYTISLTVSAGSATSTITDSITIMPKYTGRYSLEQGGNFEMDNGDFVSKQLKNGNRDVWQREDDGSDNTAWVITDEEFEPSRTALYTPGFDISQESNSSSISFLLNQSSKYCNSPASLQLQYSTDGGKTWSVLGTSRPQPGVSNWYNRGNNFSCNIQRGLFPDQMGWTDTGDENIQVVHTLNHLREHENIGFRILYAYDPFSQTEDYELSTWIDDFQIIEEETNADFIVDKKLLYIDTETNFTNLSSGAVSYLWDFGDGSTSVAQSPTHIYTQSGVYTVSLITEDAIGETQNETKEAYIKVIPKRALPYTLESGGNLETTETDFLIDNIKGTTLEYGNSTVLGKDGTNSGNKAIVFGLTESEYLDESEAYIYTPEFSFLSLGTYTLSFASKFMFEVDWDGFIVEYSTNKGNVWVKLNPTVSEGWYNSTSNSQSVFGASVPIFSGSTNGNYDAFSSDVSSLAGNESVAFRFKFLTDPNTVDVGMALDDITLDGPDITQPAVPDFAVNSDNDCVGNVVTIENLSSGFITSVLWDFGEGATPTTAIGNGPFDVTYLSAGEKIITLTIANPTEGELVETKTVDIGAIHTPILTSSLVASTGKYVLTASEGDEYIWFKNGDTIRNENSQMLEVDLGDNNRYAVSINIGGCWVETSQSIINALNQDDQIGVYPTSSDGKISIVGLNQKTEYHYEVVNLLGKTIQEGQISPKEGEVKMNFNSLKEGLYLLRIKNKNSLSYNVQKIMIK